MVEVKICGLTAMKDISIVNKYRSDYAGFVFADSRRRVTPGIVTEMVEALLPSIKKVGVFVNENAERINEIVESCQLDIVQLHGDETPYFCSLIRKPVWKAIRIKGRESLEIAREYNVDALLLDTYSKDHYGGVGRTFDWDIASEIGRIKKVVLAGGLTSHNVSGAIDVIRPFCVDVSSGVETECTKDEAKVKEFIDKIKSGGIEYGK